jgi:hypothetical protein
MRILLNLIIGLQTLLGIWWIVPLLRHDGDFSTLYVLVISVAANGLFFLVAAWAVWKHAELRRRAAIVMILPVVLYISPFAIKVVFGGPLTGPRLNVALGLFGGAILVFCLVFPKTAHEMVPGALVQSRFLNWLLILGLASAWLFPIAVTIWLATGDSVGSSSGTALAYAVILLTQYIIIVGAAALVLMLWAWIGLRGGNDRPSRKLHITQLVMGFPSLVLGVVALSWLVGQL